MSKWPYSTARWKRLRAAHLALEPACRGCKRMGRLTLANTVDHVVAISEGGHAFPGHDGLASYCPACHSAKTARGSEARSEEHTSELQSLMRISYAVFCLKKKTTNPTKQH